MPSRKGNEEPAHKGACKGNKKPAHKGARRGSMKLAHKGARIGNEASQKGMFWDCRCCKSSNYGRVEECQTCGDSPDFRFYHEKLWKHGVARPLVLLGRGEWISEKTHVLLR